MKKFCILITMVLALFLINACSIIVPKEKTDQTSEAQAEEQPAQDNKTRPDISEEELKLKVENASKEYKDRREKEVQAIIDKNKAELDKYEQDRISRDKSDQTEYDNRRKSIESIGQQPITQLNSAEIQRINNEYNAEKDRINKEYSARLDKIRKEYEVKIAKIEMSYEDDPDGFEKMEKELRDAEEAKFNQECEAENIKINQEYNADELRAKQEKEAEVNGNQRLLSCNSKNQERKIAIDRVIKTYEDSIQSAKTLRDGNKESFMKNCSIKYDEAYNKLSSEEKATSSVWEKLISAECKEIYDYCQVEDKKYQDYVKQRSEWKKESIDKLLN